MAAGLGGPIEEIAKHEAREAESLLDKLKVPVSSYSSQYVFTAFLTHAWIQSENEKRAIFFVISKVSKS